MKLVKRQPHVALVCGRQYAYGTTYIKTLTAFAMVLSRVSPAMRVALRRHRLIVPATSKHIPMEPREGVEHALALLARSRVMHKRAREIEHLATMATK
jgi:hypothetical protein